MFLKTYLREIESSQEETETGGSQLDGKCFGWELYYVASPEGTLPQMLY